MEKVSVIIPVYNTDIVILNNCVDSVINQDYKKIEIIIIDDGSNQSVAEECDRIGLVHQEILVIHTDNKGVSCARNVGLDIATGDLIMFIDSDDYISKTMISHMVNALKDNGAECCMCGCTQTSDLGTIFEIEDSVVNSITLNRDEMLKALYYMHHPYECIEMTAVWGTMYKRSSLCGIRFNQVMTLGEDFVFKNDVFNRIEKLVCLDYRGYIYHIIQTGIMRSGFNEKKLNVIDELQLLIESNASSIFLDGLICRAVNIAFVIYIDIPSNKKYKTHRKQVEKFIKKYRKCVVANKEARKKVKGAVIVSYISFSLVRVLMKCHNRLVG